ncbi:TM0106 family RecB-like putative nuclease [Synechococcus sp. PCC 7336]|uniref:TM0106 family RecB-like putative nuclease n=1 Tax=Synechococcus sp. PCC 7336 TaxID=195250 RepID=UPI00034B1BCB|nr:TM0106 family RecB-like putative nuclease [Synechococcus sp. PCC 7336]
MKWIAAEDLLSFRRCRRQPYLRHFGLQEQQSSPSDFLLQLRQGRKQQRQALQTNAPGIDVGAAYTQAWPELYARVLHTLELMEAGDNRIYGGVLCHPLNLPGQPLLVSCPDVLVRSPLPDCGTVGIASTIHPRHRHWTYQPADVRTGKRVKPGYALVLALHAEVLQLLWGHTSESAIAILRDNKWRTVNLTAARQQARQLLREYVAAMSADSLPDVYVTRSRCNLCTWQEHCRDLARQQHPLTLLPGVTATAYAALQEVGLIAVDTLAEVSPEAIQHLPGIGLTAARRLVRQARATATQAALPARAFSLPRSPIELYFDIEAEPQQNVSFLLGVLAVNRQHPDSQFYPHLAETPADEAAGWAAFVQLTQRYPSAPIYHFHAFEVHACRQLAEQYGTPRATLQQILKRMVDLHEIARECVVMPVESYSLKHVAQWLGFRWRQANAGGAQAVYWYTQWLQTGDRSFLEAAAIYNEDDCRATYHLKRWLEQWQAKHYPDRPSDYMTCKISAS